MLCLTDKLLAGGCVKNIGALNGGVIKVLTGPQAGAVFRFNSIDHEADGNIAALLSEDPRPRRRIQFAPGNVPDVTGPCRVQTVADGKIWQMFRQDFSAYLTTDFELQEIAPGKDT